jgi:hypothetical protein
MKNKKAIIKKNMKEKDEAVARTLRVLKTAVGLVSLKKNASKKKRKKEDETVAAVLTCPGRGAGAYA